MEHQVVWLGGLFQPEAWLTATHQAAAKVNHNIFSYFKTIYRKDYVFDWMSHSTHVISLSPQAKWYVLILFKYLIELTCLKHQIIVTNVEMMVHG